MTSDSARFPHPDARSLASQIGAGRTAIAAGIMVAPVLATRLLGADTATAQRVTWLTRMLAVRDGALGVGAAVASRSGGGAGWVLGGAVSDAVDAVVLAAAIKQGRLRGALPAGTVVAAAATAAAGFVTAARLRRAPA
jgi:hypothetical protein